MDRDRLVMGLAAVFVGITTLLVVVGIAEQPLLLVLVPPFAATAYLMWYHASGRLVDRLRSRPAGARLGGGRPGENGRFDGFGGFGAGPRVNGSVGGRRTRADARRPPGDGPTRAEAYRTLDLSPEADADEVRRAYRSKVKEVHPDADSGDEEAFKRVNRAYERLTD